MVSTSIRKAFEEFDVDGSGTLSAEECLAILTRGATDEEKEEMGMTEDDAREIIQDFDKNGDGVLSIEEFVEAFEMFMLDEDEFQNGAAPAEPDDDEDDELAALPAQPAAQPVGATVTSPPPPAAPKAAAPAPRAYSGFPIEGPGFKVTLLRLRPRSSPLLLPHLCSLVPCPGPIVERCTLPKRGRVSASR